MKRFSVLMITFMFICVSGLAIAEKITAEQLQVAIDQYLYVNLFDVRTEEEYNAGAIPGAVNFPLEELRDTIQSILNNGFAQMSAEIYLYGTTEEQEIAACEILSDLGFQNVYYLTGGIANWPDQLLSPDQLLGNRDTQDIYGNTFDMAQLSEYKLIMVNVWATYCQPCIMEMAGLGDLAREMKENGVLIIGLVSDCSNADMSPLERNLAEAIRIAEETKVDYPQLLPNKLIFSNVISKISAVPTTFFLDSHGMMIGQTYVGSRDEEAWKTIIETTLSGLQ